MPSEDIELAEALWERSKEFVNSKEYYNALLDISAAYRFLSLGQDPRVPQVHQEWVQIYQKYNDGLNEATETSSLDKPLEKTQTVLKLENLLKQIEQRRR